VRFKKLRKIYRILFPKITTNVELFENKIKQNPLITSFKKIEDKYLLSLDNAFSLVLRNHYSSDYEVFKQIFNFREYEIVINIISLNNYFKEKKL
jgi:hypothetical protein